ncbi:MAG: hypothetical protein F4Y86_17725 [Gammaproteobacteria bacterium]|nr:zinc dependent phospholipase C family protein [Gammaproteobacteria bacterium]MXY54350.1 hypothetical protein [Gammaproteobacteria bacterium]MYB36391.1 hypothetical protein [Gammaproteobacteria bacterium]
MAIFYSLAKRYGLAEGRRWEPLIVIPVALIGTWVPDWDLFFGIGFHRSPFFHSALPVLPLLVRRLRETTTGKMLVVGMSLGVASHLLWDTIAYGNVIMIPGGMLDRLFLLVNSAVCVCIAWRIRRDLAEPLHRT